MEVVSAQNSKLANFYLELMDLTDKVDSIEWKADISDQVKAKWLQGIPVLTDLQPEVDTKLWYEVILNVVLACQKWQPGPQTLSKETVSLIKELNDDDIISLTNAVVKNVPTKQAQWAKKLNISEDMMDFLAFNIAKPILSSYAAAVIKQLDTEKWNKNYCPVCGNSPVMAKLTGKVGIRKLHCGQCETEWRFDRVGCPYCGNKDTAKLSFITPENNKQYRLYLCEECKSYLKTVDERQCGEVDLFCEELATADFDRLAVSEGYHRGSKRYHA